ncbi:hypothetical protein [Paenibacillus sp. GCM10028914]|uniref:hypothetical protein n=1 Tax=Paenibacillus sp. GCM10028914 TaxID=3273416 RepID=UPI00361FEB4F
MKLKSKIIFISAAILGLMLLPINHLGNSLGDDLFRWIGVSPWTKENNNGLHLPVVIGFILLIFGSIGVANIYKPRYPKISSRLLIGYIVFIYIFPFLTEQIFFLTKFNSSGISSVAFSKKDSECNYSPENEQVKAVCTLNIYNYGKQKSVTIRPIINPMYSQVEFKPKEVSLTPRSQRIVNVVFYGDPLDESSSQGWVKEIGAEIEVNGDRKTYK